MMTDSELFAGGVCIHTLLVSTIYWPTWSL